MKNKSKIKYIVLIIIQLVILFSCNNIVKENNKTHDSNETNVFKELDEAVNNSKIDYKYYDVLDIAPAKIIVPKNQTVAQGLSVLVNDGNGNLIVIDGGRVEDADYLCDIIKDNGGVVKTWFITHIHDDHIGALLKILNDKRTDIEIKELYYDFASFDWYYNKMGNDAGIYYLFENAIKEYNDYLKFKNNSVVNITKQKINQYSDMLSSIALNDVYTFDQDPINNTSIVYLVSILNGKHNMVVFGDLGYEGGKRLFTNIDKTWSEDFFKSDIIVLAHHGQNGIDPELYKKFSPKVVVWPTSKDIYENEHGTYYTDDTKKVLSEINSIEYQIKSYEETAVIR